MDKAQSEQKQNHPMTDWRTMVRLLGWAGVMPFAFLPLITVLDAPIWVERLLQSYGVLILAFLCGTLWQEQLRADSPDPRRLLLSNLLLLAAWPVLILPLGWGSAWLASAFLIQLLIDRPWHQKSWPGWYRRLRVFLSVSAIALLIVTWLIATGRGL